MTDQEIIKALRCCASIASCYKCPFQTEMICRAMLMYSNGTEYVPIYRMKQWFEHCRNQQLLAGEEGKHD